MSSAADNSAVVDRLSADKADYCIQRTVWIWLSISGSKSPLKGIFENPKFEFDKIIRTDSDL